MTSLIIPSWTTPTGERTGPSLPAVPESNVARVVADALDQARRERGTNVVVQIVDDLTGRVVARVRPRVRRTA